MKQYTKEQIVNKCIEIWEIENDKHYSGSLCKDDIVILVNRDDLVLIQFKKMYEPPVLNLAVLMALAEFFDTKNINDDDRFSNGGCDTCDYGSSYGFTLTIRNE